MQRLYMWGERVGREGTRKPTVTGQVTLDPYIIWSNRGEGP